MVLPWSGGGNRSRAADRIAVLYPVLMAKPLGFWMTWGAQVSQKAKRRSLLVRAVVFKSHSTCRNNFVVLHVEIDCAR